MTDSTFQDVMQPDAGITDPLHELLRKGARDLIAKAVEAELTTFGPALRLLVGRRHLQQRAYG